ncbi:EpsG family protein [Pectobacterium versatile]|uniref:EpsG family protein n=1 Tax=Pectobacterium versatile TaxID=2488639 RepID=UPI001F2FFD71|nr:EpsG family protein [Pectobacterium versatile]
MYGNARLIFSFLVFVVLSLLYVFKYDGNDYSMYMNYYYSGDLSFEIGYEVLVGVSKFFGLKFEYFYSIYNAFNLILYGILCRWRGDRMLLGLVPLMLFPGLPLNTIRQFTAGLICAIAYDRYFPENRRTYIMFIFLACQFHISAVFFLLPLARERMRMFFIALPVILFALVYFDSYTNYIFAKISYYYGGDAKEGWYEQSTAKTILFVILSLLMFISNYFLRLGEYIKYRPIMIFTSIFMLASAETSIFMRFIYLFIPALSVWMSTCSKRVKWMVFFPIWIIGAINIYFVWVVWSGSDYIHRNYIFDMILWF